VRLVHGTVVGWDGRWICHCTGYKPEENEYVDRYGIHYAAVSNLIDATQEHSSKVDLSKKLGGSKKTPICLRSSLSEEGGSVEQKGKALKNRPSIMVDGRWVRNSLDIGRSSEGTSTPNSDESLTLTVPTSWREKRKQKEQSELETNVVISKSF